MVTKRHISAVVETLVIQMAFEVLASSLKRKEALQRLNISEILIRRRYNPSLGSTLNRRLDVLEQENQPGFLDEAHRKTKRAAMAQTILDFLKERRFRIISQKLIRHLALRIEYLSYIKSCNLLIVYLKTRQSARKMPTARGKVSTKKHLPFPVGARLLCRISAAKYSFMQLSGENQAFFILMSDVGDFGLPSLKMSPDSISGLMTSFRKLLLLL